MSLMNELEMLPTKSLTNALQSQTQKSFKFKKKLVINKS